MATRARPAPSMERPPHTPNGTPLGQPVTLPGLARSSAESDKRKHADGDDEQHAVDVQYPLFQGHLPQQAPVNTRSCTRRCSNLPKTILESTLFLLVILQDIRYQSPHHFAARISRKTYCKPIMKSSGERNPNMYP